jgi:carbamoyltransferase
MKVLGVSCFYHDSAAALLVDGRIVAAAQEERFTRLKHDSRYPTNAIKYCLSEGRLSLSEIDAIVFYEKPFLKFERLLETYLNFAPVGFRSFGKAIPIWMTEKIFTKKIMSEHLSAIDKNVDNKKIFFSEHHLSHAASAFYPSPFHEAIVLTMDGVGEWATSSLGFGKGSQLQIDREIHFPHSLGLLYSAFTYFCGFKVNSGEYKLMGLAPYGKPKYTNLILDHLIDVKDDGSFKLNIEYFNYPVGLTMTNDRFNNLFKMKPRLPHEPLTQAHMDLAASIQAVTEEIVLKISAEAVKTYQSRNLCLAGGVALNCVANGKILQKKIVDHVWIQPAAGDAGGSLGAALAYYYSSSKGTLNSTKKRIIDSKDSMQGSYLGPSFTDY